MKKVLFSLLFTAFILTGVSFAQTTPSAGTPAVVVPVTVKPVHHDRDRHPELHKAMRKLRGAKQDLEKAENEYGGHKVKAIIAINRALEELKDAIATDKE